MSAYLTQYTYLSQTEYTRWKVCCAKIVECLQLKIGKISSEDFPIFNCPVLVSLCPL